MIYFFLIYLKESKLLDKQFFLLKHIIIYGFTISLSTISNYEMVFYFFLSFQVEKNNMLLIAIVSLQYILLQYSLCSICLDNLQVIDIYIYIYISVVVIKKRVLQKPQLMNCGHAKIMSYEPHMHTQSDKTFNLPLCIQQVGPKG